MKVLVTGAAGFIGAAVAAALRRNGHRVLGVDAFIPQAHRPGPRPDDVLPIDLREPGALDGLLADVDVVCHQAAMVGLGVSAADLPQFAGHNDLATARVLAAMAEHGVDRLVLASSMVVYGEGRYACPADGVQVPPPRSQADLDAGRFEPRCPVCAGPMRWGLVDEDARLDPRSGYAASKVAQEQYAAAWARQCDGGVLALRYHNVYGPAMPRDTPYSGVAALFRSALEHGRAPTVFEDGGQMRDFVHVDDVAAANVLASEAVVASPAGSATPYNICSGYPISIAQVARRVADGVRGGIEPLVTGQYRPGDVRHIVASPERATQALGFRAEVHPDQGLRDFARAPLRD